MPTLNTGFFWFIALVMGAWLFMSLISSGDALVVKNLESSGASEDNITDWKQFVHYINTTLYPVFCGGGLALVAFALLRRQ